MGLRVESVGGVLGPMSPSLEGIMVSPYCPYPVDHWRVVEVFHAVCSMAPHAGRHVYLELRHSREGDKVLWLGTGEDYCSLSLSYSVEGAELDVGLSGLGTVWSSLLRASQGWRRENITFDLLATSVMAVRNLTFSLGSVSDHSGSVHVDDIVLYPCTECSIPSECGARERRKGGGEKGKRRMYMYT